MQKRCIQVLVFILLPIGLMAEITVTADFNPARIALGDRARYLVTIKETSDRTQPEVERVTSLPIPNSAGLRLSNGRTSSSQQTQIRSGAAEYNVTQTLIIDADATSVGSYTIPAFSFNYKGVQQTVPAATLEVVERPADATPPRDELIVLRADLPDRLYVGQKANFTLKLYLSEEVQLDSLNRFDRSADGYTVSSLPDDPDQRDELVEGRRYRVLSWPMALTPIQTGPQPLRFEFGLSARLPQASQGTNNTPFGRSPFGRSIFDDFFGRTEQMNINTDTTAIEILPLPESGQPENFSGAIGDFAMEVGSDSKEVYEGEPVMLSVHLRGRGNFDRIEGPVFPESDMWRMYAPEAKFEASDPLGLRGNKRFDYVVVPQKSGDLEIPETNFSYFDPEKQSYITLNAPSIPIRVRGATFRTAPSMPETTPQSGPEKLALSRNLSAEEALLTLDYQPKKPTKLGTGIIHQPGFIAMNGLAAALFSIACFFLHRSRKHREDPRYRLRAQSKAAAKVAAASARKAAQEGDADRFFSEASRALRARLTGRTTGRFQAASIEEIASAMDALKISAIRIEEARAFFNAADAQRFGRQNTTTLKPMLAQFEAILKEL